MKKTRFMAIILCIFLLPPAMAADRPSKPMPAETPELIEQGHEIYTRRCSFCHGLLGDGNGPAADYMDPRPRDFTLGTFKFRTTQSGELPINEDLFRTVSRGLSGTAMQSFDRDMIKNGLTEDQRWAVIAYIKTFAMEFADPDFDPYQQIVPFPTERAPYNEDTIARGKIIFERAKCWECHGKLGRGDGLKAFDKTDDWGFPIRIRNVTHPWKIKAGIEVEDIYMRFSTGINGTPMPSFVEALTEEERWDLANFIKSLQHKLTGHQVLDVRSIDGDVPGDPDDPRWAEASPMDIRLTGQATAAPRWQNASIEMVTLKAVFNSTEIAFLIEWDDPFKDVVHKAEMEFDPAAITPVGAFNSYVQANDMIPRQLETFRDSIALQFPVKPVDGTRKPHFLRGSGSQPVHLWVWNADLDAQDMPAVTEAIARGWKQPPKLQTAEQQQITSTAAWDQGRWRVVMKRPLVTEDKIDVQFVPGKFIPMAINAWDGSNGEHRLIMSVSSWYYLTLEAPTPPAPFIYAGLAILFTGLFGVRLTRKAQMKPEQASAPDRESEFT
ncbi:MAG: c-type cytochrome [Proteobacteria bacterium]|nr:c-type cytochrome [Pseudomonadota bacterium]